MTYSNHQAGYGIQYDSADVPVIEKLDPNPSGWVCVICTWGNGIFNFYSNGILIATHTDVTGYLTMRWEEVYLQLAQGFMNWTEITGMGGYLTMCLEVSRYLSQQLKRCQNHNVLVHIAERFELFSYIGKMTKI